MQRVLCQGLQDLSKPLEKLIDEDRKDTEVYTRTNYMRGINTIINSVNFDLTYIMHIFRSFLVIRFLDNVFMLYHIYFITIIKSPLDL